MKNIEELLGIKERQIANLEETIKIYEEMSANNRLLKEANNLVELSYKAVIKEQRKVIIYLSTALVLSIIINFI